MERRYALTDAQWERLSSLDLPGSAGYVGRTARDTRLFNDATCSGGCRGGSVSLSSRHRLTRLAGGVRQLASHLCPLQPLEQRGVWQRIFEQFAQDKDNEYAMIESTSHGSA